jgi:uncharacterized membrane protein YkoI
MSLSMKIILLVLTAGSLVLIYVLFVQEEESLDSADVAAMVENRYQAEIKDFSYEEEGYLVVFHTSSGEYRTLVDPISGEILEMELTNIHEESSPEEQSLLLEEEIRSTTENTVSGDVDISSVELQTEGNPPHYEVIFSLDNQKGRLEIDAYSGSVELFSLEEEAPVQPMTEEEASEIALSEHPGEVDDIDLEEDNGRLVFEIEIENDSTGVDADIVIDAYTGEIISVEYDD